MSAAYNAFKRGVQKPHNSDAIFPAFVRQQHDQNTSTARILDKFFIQTPEESARAATRASHRGGM